MKDIDKLLIPLIKKGGDMMLTAHDVESHGEVSEKAGDAANMVTVYDVAIQNFLMGEILKLFPTACFIAEEKDNDPAVLESEYCFIIDPIDGTANFVHDYRHSCVSLALLSYGKPYFAAIYDPFMGEMFSALQGQGAYLNGRPMHVSDRGMKHSVVAFGTSPYYKETLSEPTLRLCYELLHKCSDLRRCGSAALDLAYLAAGRNDIFFELRLSPWDIAAGALLISEAGGIISDTKGRAIDFSAPTPVIAANPVVYEEFLDVVKETVDL